jgi:hypothetical protein
MVPMGPLNESLRLLTAPPPTATPEPVAWVDCGEHGVATAENTIVWLTMAAPASETVSWKVIASNPIKERLSESLNYFPRESRPAATACRGQPTGKPISGQ